MRRIISILSLISLVLLIAEVVCSASSIDHFFHFYNNRPLKLKFTQISVNGMSGQRISRSGILIVKPKQELVFDYPKERVIINDFEVVDYKNGSRYVYKLTGFNRVLFHLFLGQKKITDLFRVKKTGNNTFVLLPRYKSSIDRIYVRFDKNRIVGLTIIDIYSNRIIYAFHDTAAK